MPEWWSYGLSDFLLFSPRTYYRMIERHNAAVWPGQIVAIGLGLLLVKLALPRRPAGAQPRIMAAVLAVLWAWVAWAFLWKRYATINWAAVYFAWAFAVQALLLVWIGLVRGGLAASASRTKPAALGIVLLALAVALYPALAPLLGRGWRQAEVFGVTPDPTAIATLGVALLAEARARWALLVVPALWCLVAGATLLALDSPEAWVPPLAALLAITASFRFRGDRSASS